MQVLARRRVPVSTQVSETHADKPFDPFSKFPKLERVKVRTPKKKNQLELLRAQRDMLNSGKLDPEQMLNRMTVHPNLNVFEALNLAERDCKLLVPLSVHEPIRIKEGVKYSASTGTLIIYESPGMPFGDLINYFGVTFAIPSQFRGKTNCALVIDHPDFSIVKTWWGYEVKLANGAITHLVENFPRANGKYSVDAKTGIPSGSIVNSPDPVYLSRERESYIGLLTCCTMWLNEVPYRAVLADLQPSIKRSKIAFI